MCPMHVNIFDLILHKMLVPRVSWCASRNSNNPETLVLAMFTKDGSSRARNT